MTTSTKKTTSTLPLRVKKAPLSKPAVARAARAKSIKAGSDKMATMLTNGIDKTDKVVRNTTKKVVSFFKKS